MPVRSKAQARWLGANRPDLLRKWQMEAHRNIGNLPNKVKRKSNGRKR